MTLQAPVQQRAMINFATDTSALQRGKSGNAATVQLSEGMEMICTLTAEPP